MRILMSMWGWKDSGGGTIFPRQLALELQRRGHEVMVVSAAVPRVSEAPDYVVSEQIDEGVRVLGIHNRPTLFFDESNPRREVSNPDIVAIFKQAFEQFQPDLVHYHNFLGLSLGIAEIAHAAGVPSLYTPYNFWLLCPTLYLNLPNLALCRGVNATGSNCLGCTGAHLPGSEYVARRDRLRADYSRMVGPCLATSENVRELLLENGYPDDKIEILKLGNDRAQRLWEEVGLKREPNVGSKIRIGFMGSLLPIKGVHTLVAAAQELIGDFEVVLHGEGPEDYVSQLRSLDIKGKVRFAGRFPDSEHGQLLTELDLGVVPSICFDHSPLVIGEFQAARVPVIGARIGGIPDYIQPGTGALYEAGDVRALAKALQALIDDPAPILSWQAAMEEPLSYTDYVDAIEARYVTALAATQKTRSERRIGHYLSRRTEAQTHYQSDNLLPLTDHSNNFGLDLSSAEHVSTHTLSQAAWITSPDPDLLPEVARLAPAVPQAFIPYWSGPIPAETGFELPTDKQLRLLLPLSAEDKDWPDLIKAWNNTLSPESELSLILLPWHSEPEACQEKLLALLDTLPDPEGGAEMILLEEAGSHLEGLAPHFDIVALTPAQLKNAPTRWRSLNAKALLLPELPADLSAVLKPTDAPDSLQPWLAQLTGWQMYTPDPEALEQRLQESKKTIRDLLVRQ